MKNGYIGRFAPSPTGPLHFGSLVAALASYLDARHHQGQWLVRIEDLDPPRESPQAPQQILSQLAYFGLHWDQEPLYQSTRLSAYETELNRLWQKNQMFNCICSRKSFDRVYPGTCRDLNLNATEQPSAERIRVGSEPIRFDDLILGNQTFDLASDVGDFILKRKDGLFAYQLAVVVDDEHQGITHVIRGYDLLDSTPKQIHVANQLDYQPPSFGHFPVVLGADGTKLSKQAKSEAVPLADGLSVINRALTALGQPNPLSENLEQQLSAAITQWDRTRIPATTGIPLAELY